MIKCICGEASAQAAMYQDPEGTVTYIENGEVVVECRAEIHYWEKTARVGQWYWDESNVEEPRFKIIAFPDDDSVAELDNGQWYCLNGPDGLLAKLAFGVVRPIS